MSIPGHTNNPNGRPLGKANKRSRQLAEEAEEAGADPGKILIAILAGTKKEICGEPITKDDYKWALDVFMPYAYGKRKPVDSNGDDSRDPLSDLVDELRSRR